MKRFYSFFIGMVLTLAAAWAQTNPNRVLVHEASGNVKGFLVERVDSMSFAKVEGRVAADAEVLEFAAGSLSDTLWISITRTPDCAAFKLACIPANYMGYFPTEAQLAAYVDQVGENYYYDDFTKAQLTGIDLADDADYVFATVGYDRYGIACGVSKSEFHTPRPAVLGTPQVECTVDAVDQTTITFSFKPNEDTGGYAFCIYPKGQAESDFNSWGPMFGFATIGDMVRQWGITQTGNYTHTYTGMNPGSDYELYIQPWDASGNNADYSVVSVSTQKMGGEGLAEMTITVGEFGGNAGTGYYQVVTYTPNDQVSLHRDIVLEKKLLDSGQWTEETVVNYLKEDNPYDPEWNQYGVDVARWGVDPATAYVAYSIAQNINGEWGPLASVEFTTPEAAPAAAPAVKGVAPKFPKRIMVGSGSINNAMPKLTTLPLKKGIQLTK